MNLQEARTILEISDSATPEEAKKKYRELTKKYHPDVNKEPGADEKFKKINEAYSCVQNGKGNDREDYTVVDPFENMGFRNPFSRQRTQPFNPIPIQLQTTVTFKESVLGCRRELSFSRRIKCPSCNGSGQQAIHNGCDKCHGLGTITRQQGNMIFTQTCDKCSGKVHTKECDKCKNTGSLEADVSIQVNIPGGVRDGNVLRLNGMGNFAGGFMGMDQYTDAHLRVTVIPAPNMTLEGNDVVSHMQLSLVEALVGCTKTVETVHGSKDITISPKSRHKEEIIISKSGVDGIGSHRVVLDVRYPDDISKLIESLSKTDVTA